MKLKPCSNDAGILRGYAFQCPGCDGLHVFYTAGPVTWAFDGNLESPTFTPSLRNTCDKHPDPKRRQCHLNLTRGILHYHPDSSHDLAGKTIELPNYPE